MATAERPPSKPEDAHEDAPEVARPEVVERPASASGVSLDLDDVRERFLEHVVPRTPRSAQLLLRSARIEALDGLLLTIAVASEEMRQNTELIAPGLKAALEHEFKVAMTVFWTVDTTLVNAPAPTRRATSKPIPVDDEPDDADATVLVVDSVADHLITEMFPGSEEIS
jgi:hypothetical protein